MCIFKTLLSVIVLAFVLGCTEDTDSSIDLRKVFKIEQAFGIKLGTIDKTLPEGYLIENKAIPFSPDTVDKRFVKYEYSTTPKSHIIYGIAVKSTRELAKEKCLEYRTQLIEEALNALGDVSTIKITEEKNQWKARENNQRQITIDCTTGTSPLHLQLVMIYQDTALSLKAFKEWKKRQKEITLIRF